MPRAPASMLARYALACVEVSIDHGLEVMHLAVNPVGGAAGVSKKMAEELIAGRLGCTLPSG